MWPRSELGVENLHWWVGLCPEVQVAHVDYWDDQSSWFSTQEAKEHVYVVGFSTGRLVFHKSKIDVMRVT